MEFVKHLSIQQTMTSNSSGWNSIGSRTIQSQNDDVQIISLTDNQVLVRKGYKWVNKTLQVGDGVLPALALNDLSDVNHSATEGHVLTFASGTWSSALPDTGATELGGLTDVKDVLAPTDGQVLTYVTANSQWEAVDPSGGGATTLGGLTDVKDVLAPTDGQVLTYVTANNQWEAVDLPSASGGVYKGEVFKYISDQTPPTISSSGGRVTVNDPINSLVTAVTFTIQDAEGNYNLQYWSKLGLGDLLLIQNPVDRMNNNLIIRLVNVTISSVGGVSGIVEITGLIRSARGSIFNMPGGEVEIGIVQYGQTLANLVDTNSNMFPLNGQVLMYNFGTGLWTSSNLPTYALGSLTDVKDVLAPTDGQVLTYVTANGQWESVDLPAGSGGTVTNVSALTLGTTGTDLTSSVANSTTTPVITLNVPSASATNRGALTSTDWSTFNGKQNTITLTTTGVSGASTFIADTLNIPQYPSDLNGLTDVVITGPPATGQLLRYNGTNWVNYTVPTVSRVYYELTSTFGNTHTGIGDAKYLDMTGAVFAGDFIIGGTTITYSGVSKAFYLELSNIQVAQTPADSRMVVYYEINGSTNVRSLVYAYSKNSITTPESSSSSKIRLTLNTSDSIRVAIVNSEDASVTSDLQSANIIIIEE